MRQSIMPALILFLCLGILGREDLYAGGVSGSCGPVFASDAAIEWECYRMRRGDTLEGVFGEYWEAVLRFNRIDQRHVGPGKVLKAPRELGSIAEFTPMPAYLPHAEIYPRYIFIDLAEQFLGAYEYGARVFSFPIASGRGGSTPRGMFRVLGRDKNHRSSLYTIANTSIPYPMYWGIKFHVSKKGVMFWLHSRDMPGFPASHGCIGLFDEEMQKKYYRAPETPRMNDAKKLYLWLFPESEFDEKPHDYPSSAPLIPIEIR